MTNEKTVLVPSTKFPPIRQKDCFYTPRGPPLSSIWVQGEGPWIPYNFNAEGFSLLIFVQPSPVDFTELQCDHLSKAPDLMSRRKGPSFMFLEVNIPYRTARWTVMRESVQNPSS